MFTVVPKIKPRWYNFRKRLAFSLVRLANKIKPKNDAVNCFWMEELINDVMRNGTSFVSYQDIFQVKDRGSESN